MMNTVPSLGFANQYETKNWDADQAGRKALKHLNMSAFKDVEPAVEWIEDKFLHGHPASHACAVFAYIAGMAAGRHQARNRKNTYTMTVEDLVDMADLGFCLCMKLFDDVITAKREDSEFDPVQHPELFPTNGEIHTRLRRMILRDIDKRNKKHGRHKPKT